MENQHILDKVWGNIDWVLKHKLENNVPMIWGKPSNFPGEVQVCSRIKNVWYEIHVYESRIQVFHFEEIKLMAESHSHQAKTRYIYNFCRATSRDGHFLDQLFKFFYIRFKDYYF